MMIPEFQPVWRKSSFSTDQANCVEVGAWNKSSFSPDQGNCVEVTATPSIEIGVRDTKDRGAGHLTVSAEAWTAFLTAAAAAAGR
ncbi:DUF397 domain-containing protein [Amycolatopsis sp. NPDC023774]|uniref:DUF397 domain-containing protein n=1 Tax=Amycolatopsis sp. NPDC023774 TaxID=3155015 RepID=UPI0033F3D7AD